MNRERAQALLEEVSSGALSPADALERLRNLPYEDLGFARVDHHRELRQGAPEVVYGGGKTPEQIAAIAHSLLEAGANVLVTRAPEGALEALRRVAPDVGAHPPSSLLSIVRSPPDELGSVAVVCAGTSDLPVAHEAAMSAAFLGARVHQITDVGVAGLHRVLEVKDELEASDVVIVVAGMDGALPSVVGGLVSKPIIAVPTSVGYGASFGGAAALLSMLNSCAAGVVVVNIDNGFGAARAAHRMLKRR